jgi:hypothetical protein
MSDTSTRSVTLTRTSRGHYVATNSRGGTLVFSSAGDESFSHDRLCTVSRTVKLGTPVAVSIA